MTERSWVPTDVRIAVVVPSFRRPDLLRTCLAGLAAQERPADEVIVVLRPGEDPDSAAVVADAPLVVGRVDVAVPGQLAAMQAGADAATTDVIAFTDDDAVPRPGWVAGLLAHFTDATVGVIGGRDVIPGIDGPLTERVGIIGPWGRLEGNHFLGTGGPRSVDVVKGVNMAYRRQALALPEGLRGVGAQVHNEIAACLWAQREGWTVLYDPDVLVDHYPGPRFDADQRSRPAPSATFDEAYNVVMAVVSGRPRIWWRRAIYGLVVGDRATPGVVRAVVATARGDATTRRKLGPSLRGQIQGLRDARRRPLVLRPVRAAS